MLWFILFNLEIRKTITPKTIFDFTVFFLEQPKPTTILVFKEEDARTSLKRGEEGDHQEVERLIGAREIFCQRLVGAREIFHWRLVGAREIFRWRLVGESETRFAPSLYFLPISSFLFQI